ncbi:MAG: redox-sensing transcriptional repressor Rex [Candidatus Omnitrophica bacterium]|nr:redox-sensing transcriptional repressor Rex [Candidatus Omnitrophota bacterium]
MIKRTINRLFIYKNALNHFKKLGFVKVFSDNLADAVGVTPSQVRKDFSAFAISGNRRGGYRVNDLLENINKILGKNKVEEVIVVGSGNIGRALIRYNEGFMKENIKIVAAFDTDSSKADRDNAIPILPFEEMADFIREKGIKVGIIAVPDGAAQHVFEVMANAGIKGVMNFAPIMLKGTPTAVISNVNLALELENIIYYVNAGESAAYL